MGWLIGLFTGNAGGYLLSAGVAALLAGAVAGYSVHEIDQIALSKAKTQTAELQSSYDAYKATIAASAAKADADALAQKQAQDAKSEALQTELLKAQQTAQANSQKLKDLLNHAAPQDARPLGPSALAYFAGLRQLQASTAPAH